MPAQVAQSAPTDSSRAATLPPGGPILVATDGTAESDAALPLADVLSSRARIPVEVISVVQPVNVPMYGVDGVMLTLDDDGRSAELRMKAAREQVTRTVSASCNWPITISTGEPAHEVAQRALAITPQLIITGRGRHSLIDRIVGGESVLRLLQLGDTPVLAVEPTLTSSPRRVVVAIDFSPFSEYALHVALSVAAPDAQITLVHVAPHFDHSVPYLAQLSATYSEQCDAAFAELRAGLPHGSWAIEQCIMHGSAVERLPEFAAEMRADLVVTATHGYGFLRRLMLGSVAAAVLRRAPCSVLAVPGTAQTLATARAKATPNASTTSLDMSRLDAELAAVAEKNLGRRCSIEIDSPEEGVLSVGHDLQFGGCSFDRRHGEVSVMFGATERSRSHLTHRISGVTAVHISRNAGHVDQAMRVAHADGQTLVLFH
jgi:nucleotide-binding universal stress UspA family protein